ncbi:hypothetical protein [Flavobacterium alkalisoli]|uniref:hypothetical protein n=1 Tax=Flavobacterium alkalisoli TaxID=2602769 RepID=UPI003A91CF32
MNEQEAILIAVPENYPKELYGFIEEELNSSNFKVRTIYKNNGVMAGIEWTLSTIVVVYILNSFFDTLLKEAYKDLYKVTKSQLKKFISKNREIKHKYITATKSEKKLSNNYDQSLTVSIEAIVHKNLKIKVLFNESVPESEMDAMLEGMFEVLKYIYLECQKNESDVSLEGNDKQELFLLANPESKLWEILTKQQMGERYNMKK